MIVEAGNINGKLTPAGTLTDLIALTTNGQVGVTSNSTSTALSDWLLSWKEIILSPKALTSFKSIEYQISLFAVRSISSGWARSSLVAFSQPPAYSISIPNLICWSVVISTNTASTSSCTNLSSTSKMKPGMRNDTSSPLVVGSLIVPWLAILYSQPTVTPIVSEVVASAA